MMSQTYRVGVTGTWLAVASFLMIAVLAFHGPIAPELNAQMQKIADGAIGWSIVHWIAAFALSLYVLTGMVVLSAESRLTTGLWTLTAWAAFSICALWTLTTAVAEATVVANAALSGTIQTFRSWWSFAEGMANGFSFFALAVAVIAGNEARSPAGVTPTWSAWGAVIAGCASFAGWALGMWFEVSLGNLLWLVSSILMSVWTLWFGVALIRSQASSHSQS